MTNETDQAHADQAQQALNSIQHMKGAAYRRSAPPHLFGVAIALLAGSLVAFAVTDHRDLQILSIVMIALIIVSQVNKSKVKAAQAPVRLIILGIIFLLPLYFIMIIFGQLLIQYLGQIGAGLMAGAIFASVVFIMNYLENKWYIGKGNQGENL